MTQDTSIRIKDKTKQRLAKHGKYGDSIDAIINRVLDAYENKTTWKHLNNIE